MGLISDAFPVINFKTVQLIKPKEIPTDKLYVKGINTMVRNDGMDSSRFDQFILVSGMTIKDPTKTRAIELAMEGMTDNNGEKNIKGKKSNPAVIAVTPVLPPSSIPTADSM